MPFGNYNEHVKELARNAGYEAMFTVYGQPITFTSAMDSLGRYAIEATKPKVFTDAAAMTAAARLDGTPAGLTTAREDVAHLPIRWNLGTEDFRGVVIEFSADRSLWETDPKDAAVIRFARVLAPDNNLEITFLRAVGGPAVFTVPAHSVAAAKPVRLME